MIILSRRELESRSPADLAAMEGCVVVAAGGEFSGGCLAAALLSDWWIATSGSTFGIDSLEGWAALVDRVGPAARRLLLEPRPLTAAAALEVGLVDAVVDDGIDLAEAATAWIGGRSITALDSAAQLIRRRGGDVLERAEFARLFGMGAPQEGLRAFLEKRSPQF